MQLSQGLIWKPEEPPQVLFSRLRSRNSSSICLPTGILRGFLRNSHQMGMRIPAALGRLICGSWRETGSSLAQPEHLKVKCHLVSSLLGQLPLHLNCWVHDPSLLLLRLWHSPAPAVNQFSSLKCGK